MTAPAGDHRGSQRRPRPVERFLGPEEGSGGPFALLGLNPADCSDDAVLSALDRQIERIAAHAECDTPEADEVRLALHAAAAQLLDPVVRRHLVAKWTGQSPPASAPAASAGITRPATPPHPRPHPRPAAHTPHAPVIHRRPQTEKLLEHDAILTLGMFGGWNQKSLRRLVALAHARGFSNEQVAATLHGLSSRRRSHTPKVRTAAPRPRARPRDGQPLSSGTLGSATLMREPSHAIASPAPDVLINQPDPSQTLIRNALVLGAVALIGLVAAVVIIVWLTSTPGPAAGGPPTPAAPTGPAPAIYAPPPDTTPAPTGKPATPPVAKPPSDLAAVAREIAASVEATQVDPAEAEARLERASEILAANWPRMPADRLIAAHDSIVEFIYRASSSPDLQLRAVRALGAGAQAMAGGSLTPDQVLPAAWSTGLMVRLSRERDLSAAAKSAVDSTVTASLGQMGGVAELTFEAGSAAALALIPQRLTPAGPQVDVDLEAWRLWAEGVEGRAGADNLLKQRLLLTGIETLLIQGAEPNESKGVAEAVGRLVVRLSWHAGDESCAWLLRWFDDRRITNADLYAVTSALASKSSAQGVDLTMVLSTSASEKSRADLRDRYATVWGVQRAVDRDELTAAWIAAARAAIERSLSGGGDLGQITSAAVLARLNEAASWQWRGDGAAAAAIVADPAGPVDQAAAAVTQGPGQRFELSDGAWGEKYLAAKNNSKVKREMLEQVAASVQELGPVDAEIIVREAVLGSPLELRMQAQAVVRQYSTNASVINALLEQLPRIQRMGTNAALIEVVCQKQLPGLRDPSWPIAARRALVERLLEAVAEESPMARVDRVVGQIRASYRSMGAAAPLPDDQRIMKGQPPAHASAAMVWARWRAAADTLVPTSPPPMRLDQIERRRHGRVSQARGMVQLFAAEQTSICEVMAYVVAVELPAEGVRVKEVLDRLATDRRKAAGVLEQINATERAMIELWLIRMQEDPA